MEPGDGKLPELPRFGMQMALPGAYSTMTWLGRGPHENYWDRNSGAAVGLYSGSVEELLHVYTRPQESSNRTDVRWLTLTDNNGTGLMAVGMPLLSVSAWPFSMDDLAKAMHTNELPRRDFITLNLDYRQMGVGGDDSWGALPHDEYRLPAKPYSYRFRLRALQQGHGRGQHPRPPDPRRSGLRRQRSGSGARVSLFDGKTLNGWTILKCEATVDNGDILIVAGNGLLQTAKKYSDFVLEFDWKPLKESKWDSGVYFRYNSVPQGRPWPARYQANLMQGQEGNVSDLPGAESKGLIKPARMEPVQADRPRHEGRPGDQRHSRPGKPTASPSPEGYIALQAEVPGGGQHRFRNIYLTELK